MRKYVFLLYFLMYINYKGAFCVLLWGFWVFLWYRWKMVHKWHIYTSLYATGARMHVFIFLFSL